MKKILVLCLALVLALAAACGTSDVPDEAQTSVQAAAAQPAVQDEASFTLPALPELTSDAAFTGQSSVFTTEALSSQHTAGTATVPATQAASSTAAANPSTARTAAKTTTTKAAAKTTTTKAAAKTTTAKASTTAYKYTGGTVKTTTTTAKSTAKTTTTTRSTTTTTAPRVTKAPQTFKISLASVQAMNLSQVAREITTINSYNNTKSYKVTGPALKDVLKALGADMSAINSRSTLKVSCTNPADPASAVYNYYLIMHSGSIFALTVDGSAADAPRLFPAVETGQTYADSVKSVKNVDTLVLTYN